MYGVHPGFPAGDDQRLTHQGGKTDLFSLGFGQGMACGNDGDPGFPAHLKALQMLRVVGRGNDRNIHQTPVKPVQHVVAAAVPQAELDPGKLLPETGDPAGDQKRRPAFHHADADGPGQTVFHVGQLLFGLVRQLENLCGPAEKQIARFGELKVPFAPDQQGDAQFLLQRLQLVTQRRLAHVQFFGGPGNIQLLGHHGKVP